MIRLNGPIQAFTNIRATRANSEGTLEWRAQEDCRFSEFVQGMLDLGQKRYLFDIQDNGFARAISMDDNWRAVERARTMMLHVQPRFTHDIPLDVTVWDTRDGSPEWLPIQPENWSTSLERTDDTVEYHVNRVLSQVEQGASREDVLGQFAKLASGIHGGPGTLIIAQQSWRYLHQMMAVLESLDVGGHETELAQTFTETLGVLPKENLVHDFLKNADAKTYQSLATYAGVEKEDYDITFVELMLLGEIYLYGEASEQRIQDFLDLDEDFE